MRCAWRPSGRVRDATTPARRHAFRIRCRGTSRLEGDTPIPATGPSAPNAMVRPLRAAARQRSGRPAKRALPRDPDSPCAGVDRTLWIALPRRADAGVDRRASAVGREFRSGGPPVPAIVDRSTGTDQPAQRRPGRRRRPARHRRFRNPRFAGQRPLSLSTPEATGAMTAWRNARPGDPVARRLHRMNVAFTRLERSM